MYEDDIISFYEEIFSSEIFMGFMWQKTGFACHLFIELTKLKYVLVRSPGFLDKRPHFLIEI